MALMVPIIMASPPGVWPLECLLQLYVATSLRIVEMVPFSAPVAKQLNLFENLGTPPKSTGECL